jgi:hypothetical protein
MVLVRISEDGSPAPYQRTASNEDASHGNCYFALKLHGFRPIKNARAAGILA